MTVDDTSTILLQDDMSNNSVYCLTFTKGSVVCIFIIFIVQYCCVIQVCKRLCKGTGYGLTPFVHPHRSVLLNSPSGLKLLVIGGRQCETFDINKTNWKEVKQIISLLLLLLLLLLLG